MNDESGVSSTFFFSDAGSGKLTAGPVWDFDSAFVEWEDLYGVRFVSGETYGTVNTLKNSSSEPKTLFYMLWKNEAFRSAVAEKWKAISADGITGKLSSYLDMISADISEAAEYDNLRNELVSSDNAMDLLGINEKKDFITARAAAFDRFFAGQPAEYHRQAG